MNHLKNIQNYTKNALVIAKGERVRKLIGKQIIKWYKLILIGCQNI